jgi:hypothetical protein
MIENFERNILVSVHRLQDEWKSKVVSPLSKPTEALGNEAQSWLQCLAPLRINLKPVDEYEKMAKIGGNISATMGEITSSSIELLTRAFDFFRENGFLPEAIATYVTQNARNINGTSVVELPWDQAASLLILQFDKWHHQETTPTRSSMIA